MKQEEIKSRIKERIKEIDDKAKDSMEKLRGQATDIHDRLLDKTSGLYEQILLKVEQRIRDHREKVHSGELQEEIVHKLKERIEKLDTKDLTAKALESLTLDVNSDLTMLWYHRDYLERKIKETAKE